MVRDEIAYTFAWVCDSSSDSNSALDFMNS